MAIFNRLRFKIALLSGLLLVGLSALTFMFVSGEISSQGTEAIKAELGNTARVFQGLLKERERGMRAQAFVLADSVQFKAALDLKVQDPATLADVADEKRNELGLDLFQVAGRQGVLLASAVGKGVAVVQGPGSGAPDPVLAKATDPQDPKDAFGVWVGPTGLFETYTRPVIIREQVLGGLRIGFAMDDAFARQMSDETGSEVALIAGGKVLASSLSETDRQALQDSLPGAQGGVGDASAPRGADLNGRSFLVQSQSLDSLGGPPVQILQLRSREGVLLLLSEIRRGFLTVLVTLLAVALILSFFIAQKVTKPLESLVAGTRAVKKGELDYRIEVTTHDELGELSASFNEMVGDLREKERVKVLFGRYLPKAVAERALRQTGDLQLGGEQRDVTIMFSDIRGFTAMSERLSPQDVVAMLNAYYTRMIDVLFENDGTLDKIIGDAIMALFGAPVADQASATNAVRTGLAMMDALRAFNAQRAEEGKEALEIGIGISAGTVVAGNLGSVKQLSYTVVGEEVNLASRLCGSARGGQILVSEAVFSRTRWAFDFRAVEAIEMKNVSRPVQIYEVLGPRSQEAAS